MKKFAVIDRSDEHVKSYYDTLIQAEKAALESAELYDEYDDSKFYVVKILTLFEATTPLKAVVKRTVISKE